MKNHLAPDDRLILDRLLSKLGSWMDGAVDFWPLVCIESLVPDRRQFLQYNGDSMRALVIVIRMLLAEAHRANDEPVATLLDRLTDLCQKVQGAFVVLEQFRTVPLQELRSATDALTEAYQDMHGAIAELANTLGFQPSYWPAHTAKWRDYFHKILVGLFDQLRHERESGRLTPASSGAAG